MRFSPSKIIILVLILIIGFGLLCLFSSCHQKNAFIKQEIFNKQLLWVGVSLLAMFFVSRLDYHKLMFLGAPLYVVSFLCLGFVLFLGRSIMGAQRWISLGEISFQPSELGKFTLVFVLAKYFSKKDLLDVHVSRNTTGFVKGVFLPLGMTLILTGLVLVQPDLGTAIVYLFIFFSIALLAEVPLRYLLSFIMTGILLFPFFWHFLKGYQKSRLLVFLNPNIDPLGAGYTIIQSKIAIGSGRLLGRGWMAGTQSQLNFLAERHTDFIFSVVGEEWGFLGSVLLLVLFGILIANMLKIGSLAKDALGRLLAVGFASVIFFHAFINIAMNVGACPVVGLPLPFISYGGSSLLINLIGMGIVLNIARQK
jgi:rod shape determining protein RodA